MLEYDHLLSERTRLYLPFRPLSPQFTPLSHCRSLSPLPLPHPDLAQPAPSQLQLMVRLGVCDLHPLALQVGLPRDTGKFPRLHSLHQLVRFPDSTPLPRYFDGCLPLLRLERLRSHSQRLSLVPSHLRA